MRDFEIGEPRQAPDAAGDAPRATVTATIPPDLRYLEGHFPGNPIVPGIAQLLLVERAVQRAWPELALPTSLRRLKFSAALGPGDQLEVHLERDGDDVRFRIERAGERCSAGILGFAPARSDAPA